MKLALIQQSASTDRQSNLQRGIAAARTAARQGASLIGFAELAFDRFYPQQPASQTSGSLAVEVPGPLTDPFCEIAREHGCVIVLNVFEASHGRTYDSSPVIDSDGSLLGVTRMVHITDYPCFHEQGYYTPGDQGAPVYETGVGRIAVAICYDRHFPEYMRALGVAGAEVVWVPQAGAVDEWPEGLYEAEMRVAAFQNGYFTALCNRVGAEECLTFAGESFVCGPDGRVLARAGHGTEEILYCEIDPGEVANSHARRLFLRDRRPELYANWIEPPPA
jgi:N-carbamoylputrescine amidase